MDDVWRKDPKAFCEWSLKNGYQKGLEIDRKNVNGNYNPENCQFVTHKENCAPTKRRLYATNSSGERNIVISKSGKYEVYITVNEKQEYIGVFQSINDAVRMRNRIEKVTGTIWDEEVTP